MHKTDHTTENSPQQSYYQTGDVRQPKSYRGIIALLLITVIILGSLVSGLSLMNIHLFRQLKAKDQAAAPVSFVTGDADATDSASLYSQVRFSSLGLTGSMLTSFDRHYYGLPAGIYITDVAENSHAHTQGICAGDILIMLDGNHITDTTALETNLNQYQRGDTVTVVIYRSGSQYPLRITLE